jgi:hypothetical protein
MREYHQARAWDWAQSASKYKEIDSTESKYHKAKSKSHEQMAALHKQLHNQHLHHSALDDI